MTHPRPWSRGLAIAAAATLALSPALLPARARATDGSPDPINITPPLTSPDPVNVTPPPLAAPRPGTFCDQSLAPAINTIVDAGGLARGRWGLRIETLDGNKVLYSRNADQFFIPASNIKLFTTAGALQMYAPNAPISSSNLGAWVRTINQQSNNGLADTLLRRIGGPAAIRDALSKIGVSPAGYRQADGSGLSRQNLVTPTATLAVLRSMYTTAAGKEVFFASLPIAGQSGTLARRFRGTPAQGRVRAKTGTLRGVRALSGYLEHPEYGPLIFSIYANHPGQNQSLVNAIDQVVLRLTQVRPCEQGF